MNEKIAVAVVVDTATADRITKEVEREAYRDELVSILDRMKQAGFNLAISNTPSKCNVIFSNDIVISSNYFSSRDNCFSCVNKI